MQSQILELPSGTLELLIQGAGDDLLVYHHGTPAAGPLTDDLVAQASAQGFRIAQIVRPGYGQSTRHPRRTVADVVPLVAATADALGHDRFAALGWSGGGPHVLATAALLPDRCVGAICLAGVAPFNADGLDFLAGMGQDNIDECGAAIAGESELQQFLVGMRESMKDVTGSQIIEAIESLLPAVDQELLRGSFGEGLATQFRFSLTSGIWGWFDDDLAFVNDWGFNVNAIEVPTQVWQGSEDLMVPFGHGTWLSEHVGTATARRETGEGHLSIAAKAFAQGLPILKAALAS
jgi:pimeloyl-ACP methyl ester carboxylesterase